MFNFGVNLQMFLTVVINNNNKNVLCDIFTAGAVTYESKVRIFV